MVSVGMKLCGEQIMYELGGACSTHGGDEQCNGVLVVKFEGDGLE
jgi:hypothetical protein